MSAGKINNVMHFKINLLVVQKNTCDIICVRVFKHLIGISFKNGKGKTAFRFSAVSFGIVDYIFGSYSLETKTS